MLLYDIYKFLDKLSPFELQEEWDNAGLQIGSFKSHIDRIYISIDIDKDLVKHMLPNSLLVTHHPLIFSKLKSIDLEQYPSIFIKDFIKKDISLISMHTNFDKTHLNSYVAKNVLGFESYKDGFVDYFEVDYNFDDFLEKVKKDFNLKNVNVVKCHEKVKKVALCTGSGASMIKDIDADLYLTGDIKYHDAMLAKALNLSLIDIKHYQSEVFFGEILEKELKNLGLEVIISHSKDPFEYIHPKGER